LWERTVIAGIVMTIGTLALFPWELDGSGNLEVAQTVALTTMVLFEAFQVANARTSRSIFRTNPFSIPLLFIATVDDLDLDTAGGIDDINSNGAVLADTRHGCARLTMN
jgi:Ca2+-transporting ATPase